jgi:hypothetical protein
MYGPGVKMSTLVLCLPRNLPGFGVIVFAEKLAGRPVIADQRVFQDMLCGDFDRAGAQVMIEISGRRGRTHRINLEIGFPELKSQVNGICLKPTSMTNKRHLCFCNIYSQDHCAASASPGLN